MLVVDDSEIERDGIRFLVEKYRMPLKLFEAEDGEKALDVLRCERDIDILFSDIKMPHMDGLQLCNSARNLYPGLHIIICSAYGEFEYARKALAFKASSYLLRPVHIDEFQKTMAHVIEECTLERELADRMGSLLGAPQGLSELTEPLSDTVLRLIARMRAPHQRDSFADTVLRFIDGHYAENLAVSDIACAAHVSPGHLCREFRKETGVSLMQFLQQFRLERAKDMLLNTDEKVHDIARLTGFQSATYFGAVFKRQMHMTPNAYRNEEMPNDDEARSRSDEI